MADASTTAGSAVIGRWAMLKALIIATSVTLLIAPTLCAAREDDITADLSPGVRASLKHRIIIEQETWPSALSETRAGREALALEARGGFRLHVRVRENPDDYVIAVIYLSDDGTLILDSRTRFVLVYGGREVESTEILMTDSIEERKVWSSLEGPMFLTSKGNRYARVRSGGYLAALRFPGNSLPKGRGWVPDAFELRGGDNREGASG
jgi:hypothetical protein